MPDKDLTCDLFRFLQLLCEGHNSGYSFLILVHQRIIKTHVCLSVMQINDHIV